MRDSRLSLVRLSGGLRLVADKTTNKKKKKPRVDYEPHSAHGRAVKKVINDLRKTELKPPIGNQRLHVAPPTPTCRRTLCNRAFKYRRSTFVRPRQP